MEFHDELKLNIHSYIRLVHRLTKKFPKEELYGIISQLRRATMSIMLNYIEGYARRNGDGCKVYNNFLNISYGSLKESKYLVYFSFDEKYINEEEYNECQKYCDKIGKMIWSLLDKK